jgi:signal peptidase II
MMTGLTMLSIAVMVVLDQLSKWLAVVYLRPMGSVPFIPGVLRLTYAHNTGAAFSMLAGRQELLIAVTAAAMLVMIWLLLRRKMTNGFAHWGLAMIVGGGIGNLIDRVLNGYVVDYFDVVFMKFAIFNVADCFVVVGCVCLFVGVLFSEAFDARRAKKAAKVSGATKTDVSEAAALEASSEAKEITDAE